MRKYIALVLAVVCVLGLVGCSGKNMTFDIGEASKISIKSGLTGDEANIADNEFIHSITENINSLRFEKTSATDGKDGYAYMLTWFDSEDNQVARVTITEENGYQISHDGYYYKVGADLNIDTELIAGMLNIALSSSEPAKDNTLEVMENTVSRIGKGTFQTAVELSDEDANTLSAIINGSTWKEEITDCESDCVINLKGHWSHYNSENGILNKYNLKEMSVYSSKVQEVDGKSFVLSEEDRITVNAILQKYITLSAEDKSTE